MARGVRLSGVVGVAASALLVSGLVSGLIPAGAADAERSPVTLPPLKVDWDYQIGGSYRLPDGVGVVSRDRHARPARHAYSICYINAYQTQPARIRWWKQNHRRLLLRRADGSYVVDGAWGENLFDIRTPSKRRDLARIVGRWIDRCARDGFDAVEPDNLDSWTRSARLLDRDDAFAYARRLVTRAHAAGLAIAQKNAAGAVARGRDVGFDFAVAEECARWSECRRYARAYDDHVLVVEYRNVDFAKACSGWADRLAIVRRDRMVTRPGSPTYVFDAC